MHMHLNAHAEGAMRTTVEIPDEQRAALAALAARRGQRGFSALVQEAIAQFLERQQDGGLDDVLALKGSWSDEDADDARRRIEEIRRNWDG